MVNKNKQENTVYLLIKISKWELRLDSSQGSLLINKISIINNMNIPVNSKENKFI